MAKTPALYKIDELFKENDLLLDKETNQVFVYSKMKHLQLIIKSPNNYRIAHRGDYDIKKKNK